MVMTLPSENSAAEQARSLMSRKDAIEAQIEEQGAIIRSHNADMQTPLVDREGFPRADIDVWAVRTARVRIIELRNDLAAVRGDLAKALERVYERKEELPTGDASQDRQDVQLLPFARVNTVAPGSPAAESGLQREDLVLKFGHLTKESFGQASLQPLAELVALNENKPIAMIVRRAGAMTALRLVPRQGWGGRGMLGCHLLPHSA
ncbi:hypothetical protein PENSPDRAFT_259418 [Peniophora sp. CONT]|nr:hypothetical protein PENSPDRAFT_259418 [Peniophora sp. CONT]